MVHSICLRFAENLAFSRIAPKNQMSVLFRVSKIFAAARMHRCQLLKCGRNATRKHKIFLPCIRNICKQKMTPETISRGKMLFGRKDYTHEVSAFSGWIIGYIMQFNSFHWLRHQGLSASIAELRRPERPPGGAPQLYRKAKEIAQDGSLGLQRLSLILDIYVMVN